MRAVCEAPYLEALREAESMGRPTGAESTRAQERPLAAATTPRAEVAGAAAAARRARTAPAGAKERVEFIAGGVCDVEWGAPDLKYFN